MIAVFLAIRLAAAASALWGVPLDRALPAAVAAVTYADDYGPELILAIGVVASIIRARHLPPHEEEAPASEIADHEVA